jgi:uncharacterized membrane-anchored protein
MMNEQPTNFFLQLKHKKIKKANDMNQNKKSLQMIETKLFFATILLVNYLRIIGGVVYVHKNKILQNKLKQ